MKTTYFTQINMWYQNKTTMSSGISKEDRKYADYTIPSTNYKIGTLLPINTKVKITYLGRINHP